MYRIMGVLGILAIAAPYILNFSNNQTALWSSVILGIILVISAVAEWLDEDKTSWEYYLAGLTGLAALGAPFLLGFGSLTSAVWTLVLIGIIAVAISAARLFLGRDMTSYQ
jgi:hypothetical protein